MRQQFRTPVAAAVALALLIPALCLAQENELREPVSPPAQSSGRAPVRMVIKDKELAPVRAPGQIPVPAQTVAPAQTPADEPRPSKFPNIDTAKNRRDYELSTPKADGIRLGRDEDSGDTVLGSTPPKKAKQADSFEAQPIQVRPMVRGVGR